ncbi:hypothetical protein [Paraburkholderia sartisoli]|uniref:hypothetical protein n=1 Tax=Paraburkholderia sartisoli TaxID=83784 RepID=UPI001160B2B6|nr:hypothetical protein [Paraburkholderia sartisoli]
MTSPLIDDECMGRQRKLRGQKRDFIESTRMALTGRDASYAIRPNARHDPDSIRLIQCCYLTALFGHSP